MEKNEDQKEKIRKIQVYLMIPIGLFIVGLIISSLVGEDGLISLFASFLFLMGITELVLGLIREHENKPVYHNENPSSNGGARTNSSYFDRSTSDLFIKEIDEYIAKEYPELPLDDANIDLKFASDYLSDIRKTAFEMQNHLGITGYIITISLRKLSNGTGCKQEVGHFLRTGIITAEIEIDANLSRTMALACLAHEMSHAYQSFKGRQPYEDGSIKEEQFTDLLTYYLGFSKFIKNGYSNLTTKLGYVEFGDFSKVEAQYSARTSSSGSYKQEKNDLKELINLYERMVEETIALCENILTKYLPQDDKKYIEYINNKYRSDEVREYIFNIKKNIDRRAKLNINMDQIGVEMKLEELFEEKAKVQRINDYLFNK